MLDSEWGRLFANWGKVATDPERNGFPEVGANGTELQRTGAKALLKSIGVLGLCIREAPEFVNSRRKIVKADSCRWASSVTTRKWRHADEQP